MKIHSSATSEESADIRLVLIGMITNKYVISKVTGMLGGKKNFGPFQSAWTNLIAGWAVKHFVKFGEPIGDHIQVRFDQWQSTGERDDATIEAIESLLVRLSKEADRSRKSSEYIADLAEQVFQKISLQRMAQAVLSHIENGDVLKAKAAFHEHVVPVTSVDVTDPFDISAADAEELVNSSENEVLFEYDQALCSFFADTFSRDSFVAYLGPEKRGKSFWLMDVVWRAIHAKRRVAYFEVGDMSRRQVLRRMAARFTGKPLKVGEFKVPTSIQTEDGQLIEVDFDTRMSDSPLTGKEIFKAIQRMKQRLCPTESILRLSNHPNSSINIEQIRATCLAWAMSGWSPDVVVIDYADILAPVNGHADTRDQINETWKRMRRLSQELHCCVVTATQADAASYRAAVLDMSNFSEDKRKLAHVTAMFGLNQTQSEKAQQIQRLNSLVVRDSDFVTDKVVFVANCLRLGNPSVLSSF